MLRTFTYKEIHWLDLENPTETELAEVGTKYNLHPLTLEELRRPSSRSKVDTYQDYLYLILHFPDRPNQEAQEVDFVVGSNFIITAHYEPINSLLDFAKIFETDLALKKNNHKVHGGLVLYLILREMYATLDLSLSAINNRLKTIEPKVFSGKEREVVTELAGVSRDLLDCQWNLKTHREVLQSLNYSGRELFGDKFNYYSQALSSEYDKVWNSIESIRGTFNELRQTNESLLAIKSNETMKLLTVLAFVFFPLSVIPQIFGMNTELPLIGQPYDFYSVLALMFGSSIVMYVLARFKKWF